jgi:hypothetical protein
VLKIDKLSSEMGMDRWMKKSLPNHFFTRHLQQRTWTIKNAEDLMGIKDMKEIALDRLKEIIEGMQNGTVRIIDERMQL